MAKPPIPVVSQGKIKLESGREMEFESPEARAWLAEIKIKPETGKETGCSFRYESMHRNASFTTRNQHIRGIGYFYGSKKVAGKEHKLYIGKLENMTIARMEEIAEKIILEPKDKKVGNPEPKTVDKKPRAVADKTPQAVGQEPSSRIEALEFQVMELRGELAELRGKLTA